MESKIRVFDFIILLNDKSSHRAFAAIAAYHSISSYKPSLKLPDIRHGGLLDMYLRSHVGQPRIVLPLYAGLRLQNIQLGA